MPINETVTQLVLRLTEGDATAFNPLHDLLMDENDPRLADLNEWLYRLEHQDSMDQEYRLVITYHPGRQDIFWPIRALFARELAEYAGRSPQQIIAKAIEELNPAKQLDEVRRQLGTAREGQIQITPLPYISNPNDQLQGFSWTARTTNNTDER